MKKLVGIWSLVSIMAFLLCACKAQGSQSSGTIQSSPPDAQSSEAMQSSSSYAQHIPPPFMNSIDYDTVDGLIDALSRDFTEKVFQEYETSHGKDAGEKFKSFITDLNEGAVPLYMPYYQEKVMSFRNEKGFSNITLFPSELYGQSWVWFFPDYEKTDIFSIAIMYLDSSIKKEANEKGGHWLMNQINPHGINNDTPYPLYDDVYEKEIQLKDRTVKARVCRDNDDPRSSTFFVYYDVLVKITSLPGSKSDEWLKELSFEKIPVKG